MTRYTPNMTNADLVAAMTSELAELQRRYPNSTAQSGLVLMDRMVRLQRELEKLAR